MTMLSFIKIALLFMAAFASASAATAAGGGAASSASNLDTAADTLRDLLREMAEASSSSTRRSMSSVTSASKLPIGIKGLIRSSSGAGLMAMPSAIADIYETYGLMRGEGQVPYDNSTGSGADEEEEGQEEEGEEGEEGDDTMSRRRLLTSPDLSTTDAQLQAAVAANTVGRGIGSAVAASTVWGGIRVYSGGKHGGEGP